MFAANAMKLLHPHHLDVVLVVVRGNKSPPPPPSTPTIACPNIWSWLMTVSGVVSTYL